MDSIDRQAAIAVVDSVDYVGLSVDDVKKVTDEVVKGLKQLPPVQPERKKGKWIKWEALNGFTYGSICSECGYIISAVPNYGTKYCPDCGADMREK